MQASGKAHFTKEIQAVARGSTIGAEPQTNSPLMHRYQRCPAGGQLGIALRAADDGNLLRGQARAAEFTKGSPAKRDAYARCLMTATATQYGLTPEQAANLADLPVFEPMTWAEYRTRYAKTTDVADVA